MSTMLTSPLSPSESLPSPTFTPPASPRSRRATFTRQRQPLAVSVSLAASKGVNSVSQASTSKGVKSPSALDRVYDLDDEDMTFGGLSMEGDSRRGTGEGGTSSGRRSKPTSTRRSTSRRVEPPFVTGDMLCPFQAIPGSSSKSDILKPVIQGGIKTHDLEIVRKLGSGSYAVVYLVREVLGIDESSVEKEWTLEDGMMGFGIGKPKKYGKEFALKCLSKHDLTPEQLETQMFEATIHLSLPPHPNIVTLHQTLQTSEWLFLILECCPGEDLYYWLERSRAPVIDTSNLTSMRTVANASDRELTPPPMESHGSAPEESLLNGFSHTPPSSSLLFSGPQSFHISNLGINTPPTPSLLSNLPAPLLLAPHRVKLISSMFSQMCQAVEACHVNGVSHRDIKPENYIVTEVKNAAGKPTSVVVKLTDFGLATNEADSEDVECGSRPYMAVECRNNLGPSYRPPPADVWSLGIVLINMLFHRNPWSDPTPSCSAFGTFQKNPAGYLAGKFPGMGQVVSKYLAEKVFCEPADRVRAIEFGDWAKNLNKVLDGTSRPAPLGKKYGFLSAASPTPRSGLLSTDSASLFKKTPIARISEDRQRLPSGLASTAPSPSPSPSPLANNDAALPSSTNSQPTTPTDGVSSSATTASQASSFFLSVRKDSSSASSDPPSNVSSPTPTYPKGLETPAQVQVNNTTNEFENRDTEDDSASNSGLKRRKRGARKGRAAGGAGENMSRGGSGISDSDRETTIANLVQASQQLAREISAISSSRPSLCMAPGSYRSYPSSFEYKSSAASAALSVTSSVDSSMTAGARRASGYTSGSESDRPERGRGREQPGWKQPPSEDGDPSLGPAGSNWQSNAERRERVEARRLSSASGDRSGSRRRGPSPADSNRSGHSHSSRTSHKSDAPSWRTPATQSTSVPPPITTAPLTSLQPPLLTAVSSPGALPTSRDSASGNSGPTHRRVLVARRTTETSPPSTISSGQTSLSAPGSRTSSIYSRASSSSVSTFATTASSSGSWVDSSRAPSVYSAHSGQERPVPVKRQTNVKQMDGLPYHTDQLPRQAYLTKNGEVTTSDDIFTKPWEREKRPPKVKPPKPALRQNTPVPSSTQLGLDTITEKPKNIIPPTVAASPTVAFSPPKLKDASTSTSSLTPSTRILTPRPIGMRSASPAPSASSGGSGRAGSIHNVPKSHLPSSPLTPDTASISSKDSSRPPKLKGQYAGSLRSMLSGLGKTNKKNDV